MFAIGIMWFDTDVIAQMVHDRFGNADLLHHVTGTNRTASLSRPLGNFFLHVVELLVQRADRALDRFAIALMFFGVNVFGVLQCSVGFAIRVGVPRIVLIVVMQIEAQFVQGRF